MDEDVRPVRWVGSALRDLKTFPRALQRDIGQALFAAQRGESYPSIKALKGFKCASVLEIVAPFETDTYRSVYTVQFGSAIYVLHDLQEEGEEEPQDAEKGNRPHQNPPRRSASRLQQEAELMARKVKDIDVTESSGNVFADLGFPNAEREQLKAKLRLEIYRAIKDRKLTQVQAGEILGIAQPHVSGLVNGRSDNYSEGRLFEFLNALGRDVEIAVRPKAPKAAGAHTSVVVQQ